MKSRITEEWKAIAGYEDEYEVSNWGRVKSLEREVESSNQYGPTVMRLQECILKPSPNQNGHLQVGLSIDRTYVLFQVHRLVLEAFVGSCPEGMQCCHYDDEPANNNLRNLRWDTPKANRADLKRNGRYPDMSEERNGRSKLTRAQVFEIHSLNDKTDLTHKEIGVNFGVSKPTVHHITSGYTWKHVYEEYHRES